MTGVDRLPHVNGGLFDARPALSIDASDVALLVAAGSQNWAHIDPTIFGTLFERLLDPDKRSQIGAHYTDATKIMMILEPVVFRPLKQEWDRAKEEITSLVNKAGAKGLRASQWRRAEERRSVFIERLKCIDTRCGVWVRKFSLSSSSGREKFRACGEPGMQNQLFGLRPLMPAVGPEIIHGIDINPLAAELARTTIWIGDIQWSIQNGIYSRPEPILRPLETIECRNALIDKPIGGDASEAEWPPQSSSSATLHFRH